MGASVFGLYFINKLLSAFKKKEKIHPHSKVAEPASPPQEMKTAEGQNEGRALSILKKQPEAPEKKEEVSDSNSLSSQEMSLDNESSLGSNWELSSLNDSSC